MEPELKTRTTATNWTYSSPGDFHPTLGAVGMQAIARVFAPEPREIVQMLKQLRAHHRWTRAFAAAVVGVNSSTVLKWEAGTRIPSGSAAKLIFLLFSQLVAKDNKVRNAWDLAAWGRLPGHLIDKVLANLDTLQVEGTFLIPKEEALEAVGE